METLASRGAAGVGSGRFAKTLIGLVCAIAMLFTGMFAAGTAQAADATDASGDVTLDWNWSGHTPEEVRDLGSAGKSTAAGTRQGDAWVPSETEANKRLLTITRGNVNNESTRQFIGWNTKSDGTGEWYDYAECADGYVVSCNSAGFSLLHAPLAADGNVLYPDGGILYAQWGDDTSGDGLIFHVERAKDVASLANLNFETYGWNGRHRFNVIATACATPSSLGRLQGSGLDSCMNNPDTGDVWKVTLGVVHVDGSGTLNLADSIKWNPQISKFANAAFADQKIKYIRLDGYMGDSYVPLGAIELRADVVIDSKLNTANSPRVTFRHPQKDKGSVQIGDSFDPSDGVHVFDAQDNAVDLNKVTIKTTGTVDTSKIGAYPVGYTVTDAQGNSVYTVRMVEVTTRRPSLDDLTDGLKNADLVVEDQVDEWDGVRLNLDKYVGQTVDIYTIVQRKNSDGTLSMEIDGSAIVVSADSSYSYGSANAQDLVGDERFVVVSWNEPSKIQEWDSVRINSKNVDWQKPVFEGADDTTIDVSASFDPKAGVTAKDDVDGDVTAGIQYPQAPDTSKPGLHELFYEVSDKAGNTMQWSRVVVVAPAGSQVEQQLTDSNKDSELMPVDGAQVQAGNDVTLKVPDEFAVGEMVASYAYLKTPSAMGRLKVRRVAAPAAGRITLTQKTKVSEQHTITVPIPSSMAAGSYRVAVIGANNMLRWNDLQVLPAESQKVPVTKVTVSDSQQLTVGGSTKLTAKVEPDNATDKSVSWSSSNTDVATVAADGTVTAVKAGKATITATANDGSGKSDSLEITVAAKPSSGGGSSSGGSSSGGSSTPSTPAGLDVVYKPTKTEYKIGEKFDTTGMVVKYQGHVLGSDQYTVAFDSSKPGKAKAYITLNSDPTKATTVEVTVVVSDVKVHRLYDPKSGEHFYTADENEFRVLSKGGSWRVEGTAFTMADYGTPVYRLYRPGGKHLLTADGNERDVLKANGWRYEGVAFFVRDDGGAATKVHRLYDRRSGDHLLTANGVERTVLTLVGWRDEGVAFTAK